MTELDRHAESYVRLVMGRLRDIRLAQGISKNRLATLAGIDPKTVSFIEGGQRTPTLYTLVKVARALEVSLAEILVEVERG